MTGKEVADKWFDQFGAGMKQSRIELAAMIDTALAAEREACAKMVESMGREDTAATFYAEFDEAKTIIAAAIRARGLKTPT